MTSPAFNLAAGMAPVFKGWNVWTVWQVNDLGDLNPMNIGLSHERRLRIWVEDQVDDNAPGAAVGDPLNPNVAKFKGDMVQIIKSTDNLRALVGRESLGGDPLELPGPATPFHVRFWNRGSLTALPWPHDDEYLLDVVFEPSADSPITNAPEPSSAPKVFDETVEAAGKALGGAAWIIGGGLALVAIIALAKRNK